MKKSPANKTPTIRPLNAIPAAAYPTEKEGTNLGEINRELNHVAKFLLKNHDSFTFGQFLQYAQSSNASIIEKRSYFDGLTRRLVLENRVRIVQGCDEPFVEVL
jgi:hypothetical protein